MQLIHCTRQLCDTLGLKDEDLLTATPRFSYLGAWYAGFITVIGRPCVLFTNERTLYTFLVSDVLPEDLSSLSKLFRTHLKKNLRAEALSSQIIESVLNEYRTVKTAPAFSPVVLMTMNDLIGHPEFRAFFEQHGFGKNMTCLNRKINRIPLCPGRESYGIGKLLEMLRQLEKSPTSPVQSTPFTERRKISRAIPL